LKISELFNSIQGEGKRTGYPSFFIRTNYCNLRCKFSDGNLCDTAYTSWFPEDKENMGDLDISNIIEEYRKFNTNDIVITGGEPAMQAEELNELCQQLKKLNKNIFITLETNGTIYDKFAELIDLISISPKLNSSVPYSTEFEKMHSSNRLNIDSFKKFHLGFEKGLFDIQWKFVICNENDIDDILELQKSIGFKNENIFLMPEGITNVEISTKRKMVSGLCMKYKMNYTDRLHILLFGNRRGY
jgi:organic radical activating enzyme